MYTEYTQPVGYLGLLVVYKRITVVDVMHHIY